ncbi:MAG TPA: GatB/YqeY domain-containing protein [Hyphomicrobiaceae bacterium]|nr:GatB/YqeY domain-containing protein [Hyphomicrobiaceae bacterium]
MMRDELNAAMKAAMRAQDKARLGTIRLILAAIKDRDLAILNKSGDAGAEASRISDGEIAQLLATMIKQRRESIRVYEEAGRLELAQKEADEILVISEFLPPQLDDEEARAAIKGVITETGATSVKDMGRVMAVLRERYRGQMDFAKASALVKELL